MSATLTTDLRRTRAFILAGGRGERLSPLTVSRPKPAIHFGGIFRIVDFTLANCLNSGVPHVAMLTQYRHEELHRCVREGWGELWNTPGHDGRSLTFLPAASGKRYRGTADAVFQNLQMIASNESENVLILSADHIYEMNYGELLAQHAVTNADVTLATVEHPLQEASHFGVVEVDGNFRVTGFQEKPPRPRAMPSQPGMALVSMGVYVFKRDVLIRSLIENCDGASGVDFGHHVIPSLIDFASVYAYDFRDELTHSPRYWRDIGTVDSYYNASMDLVHPGVSFNPYTKDGWHSCPVLPLQTAAWVSGSACVSHSGLAPGVRIEQGASVEDSVLMPGVHVGSGARLRRVIINEGVQIPADFRAGWDLEQDRKRHTVSPSGVVVVGETPKMLKPHLVRAVRERSVAALQGSGAL